MVPCALLVFLVICTSAIKGQNPRECSKDTMNMCRKNIDDVVLGNGNTRNMDLEDQCWRVRQNFDCVLWQTSMCLNQNEQEANSNVVLKAWRFLEGFCEEFKNWWTKRCYRSDSLKKCENRLPSKGRSVDKASCRGYLNFRDCAISAIERECDNDDQRYLGVFLMEKGQHRAWKCPKDETNYSDEPVNAPLASDSRDIMYSDSSFGTCVYNAAKQVQTCMSDFEDVQKTAKDAAEKESRERAVCCGVITYENCVIKILKDHCGEDGANEAKNIIQSLKSRLQMNCEDHTEATCSAAAFIAPTSIALLFGFIFSFLFSTFAINIL